MKFYRLCINKNGNLLIPKDVLKYSGIGCGDVVNVYVTKGELIVKHSNTCPNPFVFKDGMWFCDGNKLKIFYKFETEFEGVTVVEGKVTMTKLCDCECEGYIVLKVGDCNLFCFDPHLNCLNLKVGDAVKAELDIFGTLSETEFNEIKFPKINDSSHYVVVGRLRNGFVDFEFMRVKIEEAKADLRFCPTDFVELDCEIHVCEIRKI
ncbi:AbrB/MazE/SpoVT family DNA-binding domain-containing protein [Archaeoglobus sp.]